MQLRPYLPNLALEKPMPDRLKNVLSKNFVSLLLLWTVTSLSAAAPAAETVLLDETFAAPADTWQGGEIESGQLCLTVGGQGRYSGQLFLAQPALRLPAEPERQLKISLTVAGFGEKSGKLDFPSSLRCFLLPEPLPKFVEPYGAARGFCLLLEYRNPDEPVRISLFQKTPEASGFGQLLYAGRVAVEDLPLRIDLSLNAEIYRLNFSQEVDTDQGARSGRQQLGRTDFGQAELRFGARLVNHAAGGQAVARFAALRIAQIAPE